MTKDEIDDRSAAVLRRFTHSTAEQAISACIELRTVLESAGETTLLARLEEALRHLKQLRVDSKFQARDAGDDLQHLVSRER